MLALPMTICEGGGNGVFGDQLTFSGLMVFDVDTVGGIREHGRVSQVPSSSQTPPNAGCYTWWSESTSAVKRSIFMDRFVYSIADDSLKVDSIDQLGIDLATVSLTQ